MDAIKIKIVLTAVALLTLVLSGCGYIELAPPPLPAQPAQTPTTVTPSPINPTWSAPAASSNLTVPLPGIPDVVEAVKPGVVAINTEVVGLDFFNRAFSEKGAGSGWIIDPSGIIVTNNHVIDGAKTITATLDDGRTFNVDPNAVNTDPLNDLAIFRIDAQNLPALKVGDSKPMRIGDWVVAIGNSLGLGISAKQGIVSSKGVSVTVDQGQTLNDLIETSAAINPGNSGGPLVNMAGQVIGITSAKIATVGVEGMGYAISSNTALPIVQQLIKNGYVIRPWIGVGLYTVDQFAVLRYRLQVNKGVLITQVVANSPAAKAGLQQGDVIVSAGGKEVSTQDALGQVIRSTEIGKSVEIVYYRGSAQNATTVTPVESPPPSR